MRLYGEKVHGRIIFIDVSNEQTGLYIKNRRCIIIVACRGHYE